MLDRAWFVGLALIVVLSQSPQGPQPPASSQQPPRFRGGTNLVRVDALATKDGVPVQDLQADDFEILEDGTPQKIDSFEHIVVEPASPGERVDPASASEGRELAGDPRRRVFVIYLDIEHVDVTGAHGVNEPLLDFLNRVLSKDDLFGVMTPEMGPQQITFARKTEGLARDLRENWAWGRHNSVGLDEREKLYDLCFPPFDEMSSPSALVKQMIARRREKIVLDSLSDLAHYMEAIRDGRTAVITVTSGWPLYRPDPAMLKPRKMSTGWEPDPLPGALPPVGVGRGGTLMKRPEDAGGIADQGECDKDRYRLANLEDDVYLRNIISAANRANVSFYTVSPGGVSAYDPVHSPRTKSLEELSLNTNGAAVLSSNDMGRMFRRIADELTSYYLFGYYSTNTRLDGRYRTITVKSKRPGVEVRARQGYRAASAAEANAVRAAADPPIPEEKAAITQALGAIERDARAQSTHVRLPGEPALFHRGPSTGNQMQPATVRIFPRSDRVHIEMEAPGGAPSWAGALLDRTGATTAVPVSVGDRTDASGQRWLTADLALAPLGPGDYVVELTTPVGAERRRTLVAIRVTR